MQATHVSDSALAIPYRKVLEVLATELIDPQFDEFVRTVFTRECLKAIGANLFLRDVRARNRYTQARLEESRYLGPAPGRFLIFGMFARASHSQVKRTPNFNHDI